jgi:uncharacterized protein (DUF305 family)
MLRVNSPLAVMLAALALAGCSGDASDESQVQGETAPNIVQPGAPGEPTRTLTPEELAAIEPPDHTEEDVAFVQGMIHHHAQALRMTALVPKRSAWRDLEQIALRMDASQEAEIEQMQSWLEARDVDAPELHRAHGHAHGLGQGPMPGMLTEAQMKRLTAAKGKAFDRLFLRFMIQHHRGALTMVQDLYAGNGGVEPEVDALARHIDSDQLIEIGRMQGMQAELATR